MKTSRIISIAASLAAVPLTVWFGMKIPGRGYYITATLILIELTVPFFIAFEGRRPEAKELVVVAVMCALAVVGRVAIPIPHLKAAFAVIMISGVALGPETGFIVGAVCALASNFFLGQGPYLPWQMMAYGVSGLLAGIAFGKGRIPPKRIPLSIFGALTVVLIVGPLLDVSNVFLASSKLSGAAFASSLWAGLPVNLTQASCTALVMFFFGEPLLEKLGRAKLKYGMTGD